MNARQSTEMQSRRHMPTGCESMPGVMAGAAEAAAKAMAGAKPESGERFGRRSG